MQKGIALKLIFNQIRPERMKNIYTAQFESMNLLC